MRKYMVVGAVILVIVAAWFVYDRWRAPETQIRDIRLVEDGGGAVQAGQTIGVDVEVKDRTGQGLEFECTSAQGARCWTTNKSTAAFFYTAPRAADVDFDLITVKAVRNGQVLASKLKRIGIVHQASLPPLPPQLPPRPPLIFGFDEPGQGSMGWRLPQDSAATTTRRVSQTAEQHHEGTGALRIELNFSTGRQTEELSTDLVITPPVAGPPYDLSNRILSGFIKFRRDFPSILDQNPGVQLFIVDEEKRSLYGCWKNIEPEMVAEELWINVVLPTNLSPGPNGCRGAVRTAGFDATRVRRVGVKIAANAERPLSYQGPCYLDSVKEVR